MPFFVDHDKIERLKREKELQKLQEQIEMQNKIIEAMMYELQDVKTMTVNLLNNDDE